MDEAPQKKGLLSQDIANSLKTIAKNKSVQENNKLSLPEINAVAEVVSQVAPAGDIPEIILNGLTRLPGRRLPPETVKNDLGMLFKGMEQAKDRAVYGTFFAGPAAVIWAYQNLLKLAGKTPEDSFPDGMWQFYVEYALREDTARHDNETCGFDNAVREHNLTLSQPDRAAAWVMTAMQCLHQYSALVANEWRERVYAQILWEMHSKSAKASYFAGLYRQWELQRPYGRDPEAGGGAYPRFRQLKFDQFIEEEVRKLAGYERQNFYKQVREAEEKSLPAYQKQMSILAYLEPNAYSETRVPFELEKAHIAVFIHGHYFLLPVCLPGTSQLPTLNMVRSQMAAIFDQPARLPAVKLTPLVETQRASLPELRAKLSGSLLADLEALHYAPILINLEQRARDLPLAELRRAERGGGDHALTIFDTGETFVFDQSHIFFDGAWGAALAEILTNEAVAWAHAINRMAQPERARAIKRLITALNHQSGLSLEQAPLPRELTFPMQPSDTAAIQTAPKRSPEASAENDEINLEAVVAQRKLFKKRNDKLQLTVNDMLVLYRAIHAATYEPSATIIEALKLLALEPGNRPAVESTLNVLEQTKQLNPAMLIPVDASQRSPRDRLQPMNFEVPLADLRILSRHDDTLEAMRAYQAAAGDERTKLYGKFEKIQREYLATLAGFGEVLRKAKDITLRGENATTGTMKLLAHIPMPLQRFLHQIPGKFDVLNDIIQGREVVSNVGAVATTSTLIRFLTAKDDHGKKALAWGFITDAQGVVRVTLRDFRPHVALLVAIGQQELANQIIKDYLDAYARGMNNFIRDLRHITLAQPQTRSASKAA